MPADGGLIPAALEGEILGPQHTVRVIALPRPFSMDRIEFHAPAGSSIEDLIVEAMRRAGYGRLALATHGRVWICDADMTCEPVVIERENWHRVRPKAGTVVTIRVVARGGGGGGKSPLRIILSIAVMVAAFYAAAALGPVLANAIAAPVGGGAGAFGGASAFAVSIGKAVVGGIVGMLGSLAINAIAPPPKPKPPTLAVATRSAPVLSITGTSNRANPYGPVPRIFGRHRVFAPLAAAPFTEIVGNDTFFRQLFDFGYGPVRLSDLRIGTTPIGEYEGIELEIREGWPDDAPITLYSNRVVEDSYSQAITNAAGPQILETRPNCDEITADLTFAGLVQFNNEGVRVPRTVQATVEYRLAGTADPWVAVLDTETPLTRTDVTTLSADGTQAVYRTVAPIAGPVTVTLVVYHEEHGGSDHTIPFFRRYQVYARAEGESAWVSWHVTRAFATQDSVSIAGAVGKRLEIMVVLIEGGPFTAPAFSYPATNVSSVLTITAASDQLFRRTIRIRPAVKGKYALRFTRITPDSSSAQIRDEMSVSAIRSIEYTPPTRVKGHCLVAMRIRASQQLNGIVQAFNAIAEALLPQWDGDAWSAPAATRSPAWAALEALRGAGNKKPVPDAKLDLAEWLAFANECAAADPQDGAAKWQFDAVVDSRSTVREIVNDILATARASLGFKDGKYYPVRDRLQTVPAQIFTPRNSWGFKATKIFAELPHGVVVRFINPDRDWSQDTVIAYADGYDENNATLFETIDLSFGVTRRNQGWREGRFHYAVAKLRPETYELHTDIEVLACSRGQLVRVAHDVPRWGASQGRIKARTVSAGDVTHLTLDERVTLEAGKQYVVRVRRDDATQQVLDIAVQASTIETATLPLAAPIAAAAAPAIGDLLAFGVIGLETVPLIVRNIYRENDEAARLELVDAAAAVHAADSGAVPEYDPQITWPGQGVNLDPDPPAVRKVTSDESVLVRLPGGGWQSVIELQLDPRSSVARPADTLEIQHRRKDSAEAWRRSYFDAADMIVQASPVDDGVEYEIRARYFDSVTGRASKWAIVPPHTVIGQTTPPPDVTQLELDGDGNLLWPYPSPPRDMWGFNVRWHIGERRTIAGATLATPVPIAAPPFNARTLPGGPLTIFVTAVDSSKNESANPAILVRDIGGPFRDNIVETVDHRAAAWPGARTNASVDSGDLAADAAASDLWPADDGAPFWPASDTEEFWSGVFLAMTYVASFTPDPQWLPATLTLDFEIEGQATIEFRTESAGDFWPASDTDPFWPASDTDPFWPALRDWQPWPGSLAMAQVQSYEIRVTTAGGPTQGRIAELAIVSDVVDVDEEFLNFAVAAGTGTRLPLANTYRVLKNVRLTLLADGGTATSARAKIDGVPPGPLIECLDAAGALVAGTVNATPEGY